MPYPSRALIIVLGSMFTIIATVFSGIILLFLDMETKTPGIVMMAISLSCMFMFLVATFVQMWNENRKSLADWNKLDV